MLANGCCRWIWLYALLGCISKHQHVTAVWPSSSLSKIQLLGIEFVNANITTPTAWFYQSRAMFRAAILLSQQYNITVEGHYIGGQMISSDGKAMNTLSSACQQISNSSIVGIVGPSFSRESHVIAPFAARLGVPIISHSSTDPDLSDRQAFSSFYRTVPSDNGAASAIASLFIKFGWKSGVIIYQDDAFGAGGAKAISEAFDRSNLTVARTLAFDTVTRVIRGGLKTLLTSSPTRIVILWADTGYSSMILQNALDADLLAPQFTWIISVNTPLDTFDPKWRDKLAGMLTVEPVVGSVVQAPVNMTLLNAAYNIWQQHEPETFPGYDNIDYYALFMFDAVWTLIQSLNQLCSTKASCLPLAETSYCFDRRLLNNSALLDVINTNTFLGVSGLIRFSTNTTDRVDGIYYVAKNVQYHSTGLTYVPVLVWSEPDGWVPHKQTNTIIWPGKSLGVPSGYAAIAGEVLRIAITNVAPFASLLPITDTKGNATQKLTGFTLDLIEQLQAKMGFIPIITLLSKNQSTNALIDAVANNVYDMIVGDVTVYANRREKVSFSAPFFDNALRIIVRDTPIENFNHWILFSPFTIALWLLILAVLLCSACLFYCFESRRNRRMSRASCIGKAEVSLWHAFATMAGHSWDFHVKTASGRVLTIALIAFSFVLIAQYQANLTSDLTIAKKDSIITGLEDLKAGKIPFSRIGIRINTVIETFYLREIPQANGVFHPLITKDDAFQKLTDKVIDAAITDAGVAEYNVNAVYCNLTLVGAPFDLSQFAIVTQKNWIYQEILDVNILYLRQSGTLDKLKNSWFQSSYCSRETDRNIQLSLEPMLGTFYIFVGGIAIALLLWPLRLFLPGRNWRLFIMIEKARHCIPNRSRQRNPRTQTVFMLATPASRVAFISRTSTIQMDPP